MEKKFTSWLPAFILIYFLHVLLAMHIYLASLPIADALAIVLPITPLTSFLKDVLLLDLIIVLLSGMKYIRPFFSLIQEYGWSSNNNNRIIATVLLQWYVLNYFPLLIAYHLKKEIILVEQMLPPPNSVPDSISIRFIYEKNGKQFEFSPEQLPADFETYKYIDRKQVLIRKGNADPPIKGFSLTGSSGELTQREQILHLPEAYLFFRNILKTLTHGFFH